MVSSVWLRISAVEMSGFLARTFAYLVLSAAAVSGSNEPALVDFQGRELPGLDGAKATVVYFVLSDCPISNQYAPELNRICDEYEDRVPRMISGTLMTIELTILSVLLGLSLAIPLAMLYLAKNPLLSMPVRTYVFYFRGTPLLVQIFLIYYGSGQFVDELKAVGLWTFFREPYFCAVLSLTLNTAAYTAYILRGAILNVPFGEIEAARAT